MTNADSRHLDGSRGGSRHLDERDSSGRHTEGGGLIIAAVEEIELPEPRRFPWEPGSATGIGSLPGTDIVDAVATVFGEFPSLPHLPELPNRGAGADMVGRTAGLLVSMPVELYVGQWRIASHSGHDARRTRDLWDRDLDTLVDLAVDYDGLIKLQAAGPWSMAASLDLAIGGRMLRDPGAVRDLVASLAEGVRDHVANVRARLPHARVLLQIDEPSLPLVLAGRVPTESGFDVFRAVDVADARSALTSVIEAAATPVVVHCCAPDAPIGLFREAGAAAVAIDLDLLKDLDPLGEVLEAGLGLFAGALSTNPAPAKSSERADRGARADRDTDAAPTAAASTRAADRVRKLWAMLGFSVNDLSEQVVITPACGLAGLTPVAARRAMTTVREAARRLADS